LEGKKNLKCCLKREASSQTEVGAHHFDQERAIISGGKKFEQNKGKNFVKEQNKTEKTRGGDTIKVSPDPITGIH